MKLYVLKYCIPYEGCHIIGVFDSKEAADAARYDFSVYADSADDKRAVVIKEYDLNAAVNPFCFT